MNKVILACGLLTALAACDNMPGAKRDCNSLNYVQNSPEYKKCLVDQKEAADLGDETKTNLEKVKAK